MKLLSNHHYDFIIVGAGAAGCILANKLSSDRSLQVLLIEVGGRDGHPIHLVPKGFYFTLADARYAKSFSTDPECASGSETYKRGRVIGGSTTINGMVWNRGAADFYTAWESAGNPGWGWNEFLGAFRAMENHELGPSSMRGGSGAVDISIAGPREVACDAFLASMAANGIRTVADMNSMGEERGSYVASNIRRGFRVSAARAYLAPIRSRPNLTIATHTEAERIVFDGTRAVGVTCRGRGEHSTFLAREEVIVAGGAFDSPLLLERSGIGAKDVLAAAGVSLVVENPGVGENFSEHRGIQMQHRLRGVRGYNAMASSVARYMWSGFKYLLSRDGVIAHGGYAVSGIYRSDPAAPHPDTQTFFTPISTSAANPMSGRLIVDDQPGSRLVTLPMYPTSRGSLHITGPGLDDQPRLRPNYLSTEYDRAMLPLAYRKARALIATEPFTKFVASELEPGIDLDDDDAIVDYGITKGVAGAHGLGTCKMGPEDTDVVDSSLRVRGTKGLRVIDASVFPGQPSGNNNAPTMALAWLAGDRILGEARRSRSAF
ncbi:GMC family oxidoreductase [Mycobacterium sp. 48b]|uniref:GMC family oxidoreductase n=1 Tax=Mycobacterium sp. 48b TaxID=3400426 RepID=UPI003AAFFC7A